MGSVWVGEHIELRSAVAIKFIDPYLAKEVSAQKRFRIEAQAAAALRSPHVVQVFDYGVDEGEPYIVMELLDGETLAARLRREGRLTVEDTLIVAKHTAKALSVAHEQGIVHRDLKPENVFLMGEFKGLFAKLLDFGVAKVAGEDPRWTELITQPGNRLGTLSYMSPEQVKGEKIGGRADVWSLAIMLFECLTGQLPYGGIRGPALISAICKSRLPAPSTFAAVPDGFDEVFAQSTIRDVEERLSSADALAERFAAIAEGWKGKCEVFGNEGSQPVKRVLAYSSTSPGTVHDTFQMSFDSGSSSPRQLGSEYRVNTSIPAAINGRRDIDHVALVAKLSRKNGVLWTRHRVEIGEKIHLALLFGKEDELGHMTPANVEALTDEQSTERPDMWPYEVTVRFDNPLPDTDEWKRSR